MTIKTNWFTEDGKLGVDLNFVQTSVSVGASTGTPEIPQPRANLGDRVQGVNGSEWVFVQAGLTVSAFNMIGINLTYSAQNATQALLVSNEYSFGVAEFQTVNGVTTGTASGGVANTGEFFWALLKANSGIRINLLSTAAPGNALFMSATAGFVSTIATNIAGGGRLNGLMFLGAVSIDSTSASLTNAEFGQFGYILPGAQLAAITV